MLEVIKEKLLFAWSYLRSKFDETELKTGLIALLVVAILLYCFATISDLLVPCVVTLALVFVVYKLYNKYKNRVDGEQQNDSSTN